MTLTTSTVLTISPLLAQAAEKGYTIAWAVVLLPVILGLVVALRPAKREENAPKPRD